MNYLEYRRSLKLNGKPEKVKKIHKIKPVSRKREKVNKEYAEKSRPFWKGKDCQIKAPGCTGKAMCVHHTKGKDSPSLLLDERYWVRSCFHCNSWVEQHHSEAVKMGFKVSRLNKHIQ